MWRFTPELKICKEKAIMADDKLHILLVDDNPGDVEIITRQLESEFPGVEVEQTSAQEQFDRALEAGRFNLVITDFRFQWSDGLAVLRAVKGRFPYRPVIMFTATGTQEVAVEAMKSGLDDYIIKSTEHYARLLSSVREGLQRGETERRAADLQIRLGHLHDWINLGVFRAELGGRLLECNAAFLRLLGADSLEAARDIFAREFAADMVIDKSPLEKSEMSPAREVRVPFPDGERWFLVEEVIVTTASGQQMVDGMAEDITERKKVDLQIQAALREKEALLRELFHRVKNNLQVVSSLLNLQSESLTDEQAIEMFRESRHRIHSMALIHERLYQAKDLARIDIEQYVHDLASELFFAYGVSAERIGLDVDINTDGAIIDIEKAVPVGLIINELLTNALKYAFPGGRAGKLTVQIEPVPGDMLKLTVADDGVGLPAGIDVNDPATLGLQLVSTLAEQLRGSLDARSQPGATFTITFPKQ
jgi:two-component sensor histidine kinase/DNA-binding response OmpR family regulator